MVRQTSDPGLLAPRHHLAPWEQLVMSGEQRDVTGTFKERQAVRDWNPTMPQHDGLLHPVDEAQGGKDMHSRAKTELGPKLPLDTVERFFHYRPRRGSWSRGRDVCFLLLFNMS